jgi:hypothetical protein
MWRRHRHFRFDAWPSARPPSSGPRGRGAHVKGPLIRGAHVEHTPGAAPLRKWPLTCAGRWCAVLGLNQSRLAKRRGRFRLICYLRTFVVAWTLADLAGRTCPALGVTRVSQVIRNSPAKPLRTGMDCNGPLWPEIASAAACSGSERWRPVDSCGPRQTGRICLRSRRPQVRILPGAPLSSSGNTRGVIAQLNRSCQAVPVAARSVAAQDLRRYLAAERA